MHWRPRSNAGAFGLPEDASCCRPVVGSDFGGPSAVIFPADDLKVSFIACVRALISGRPIYATGMRPISLAKVHIGRKTQRKKRPVGRTDGTERELRDEVQLHPH